jgi:hypothetical protein
MSLRVAFDDSLAEKCGNDTTETTHLLQLRRWKRGSKEVEGSCQTVDTADHCCLLFVGYCLAEQEAFACTALLLDPKLLNTISVEPCFCRALNQSCYCPTLQIVIALASIMYETCASAFF